jgi:hypothetical protein
VRGRKRWFTEVADAYFCLYVHGDPVPFDSVYHKFVLSLVLGGLVLGLRQY